MSNLLKSEVIQNDETRSLQVPEIMYLLGIHVSGKSLEIESIFHIRVWASNTCINITNDDLFMPQIFEIRGVWLLDRLFVCPSGSHYV